MELIQITAKRNYQQESKGPGTQLSKTF